MPIWALGLIRPALYALLIGGVALWIFEKGVAHERAAVARQVAAANKRIRLSDQRWSLKYQHDSAAREAIVRDLPALAKETCELPEPVRVQLNRIKP